MGVDDALELAKARYPFLKPSEPNGTRDCCNQHTRFERSQPDGILALRGVANLVFVRPEPTTHAPVIEPTSSRYLVRLDLRAAGNHPPAALPV